MPSAYCKELRADPHSLGWSGGVDVPTGTDADVSIQHNCHWFLPSTINSGRLVFGLNPNTVLQGSVLPPDACKVIPLLCIQRPKPYLHFRLSFQNLEQILSLSCSQSSTVLNILYSYVKNS